jgi:hypothetical protein
MPPINRPPSAEEIKAIINENKEAKENWFDSRILKTSGTVIGMISPVFAWIFIEINSLKTDVAIQKEKIGLIYEMKEDLKQIRYDIQQLKIDIATIKTEKGINK